jgi:hypothetical protein
MRFKLILPVIVATSFILPFITADIAEAKSCHELHQEYRNTFVKKKGWAAYARSPRGDCAYSYAYPSKDAAIKAALKLCKNASSYSCIIADVSQNGEKRSVR